MARLYEIAAYIGGQCLDGRSNDGAWGHERQYHATRESAEEAVARLRHGGHWGCPERQPTTSSSGRAPITRTTPSASRSGGGPAGRPVSRRPMPEA